MKFSIIHELPDRLRIKLSIPKGYSFDVDALKGIEGIMAVSFNQRTGSLLIRHNSNGSARKALLNVLKNTPLPLSRKWRGRGSDGEGGSLREKKRAVIKSGGLLLASPLIPLPLKPFVALYGAMPIFKKGIKSLLNSRLNVDVLDSSAIGAAIGMGDYRTAGIISFLLKIGDYLEEWTKDKSRKMLASAFQIGDEYAWVRNNGSEYMVKTSELKEEDVVVVRTGSIIPVDGIVIEGEAMVNQSSMTGEPLPVAKRQGLTVYAGTAVDEGTIAVKATRVGGETRVAKIIKTIEESEAIKADVQSHAERLADRLVPYSFLLSGIAYALTGNPVRAASLLLVDYSCSIKLSTPLAIMAGMMRAVKEGVLFKGGKFIEKLSKADVFVFDKTGTLTDASPKIIHVVAFNGYDRDYILKHAACVEEHFPHPVATAVVKKAADEGLIHEEEHSEVEYVLAHGVAARIKGKRILVGSKHFIYEDEGIDIEIAEKFIKEFTNKGHSILYVAIDNKLAGVLVIEDSLREDSLRFLTLLKDSGIKRIIMLTGDNEAAAKTVAEKLGIREYFGEVFPEGKAEILKILKEEEGHVVAMVGDGINDSPALSYADVGISMKHGSDIARETCDVLLLDGGLMSILEAKNISAKVMDTIRQNFKYIVGINTALIGLGLLGALSPAISAFMHNAVTVLSAWNSLMLLSDKTISAKKMRHKKLSPEGI